MRVDKYIWAVRLFKTRSTASKATSTEKVKLNGEFVKASKEVKKGDEIAIKVPPIWKTYEVLDFPKSRVGAKLVVDLISETTAKSDLETLKQVQLMNKQSRKDGVFGRPTKRHRRDLDRFKED